MIRKPSLAGRFYSSDAPTLTKEVASHIKQSKKINLNTKVRAIGVVAPHAGFMYSGDVAGAVYSQIEIPDTVILLGPNHTGLGEKISIMSEGLWRMPQGDIKIDNQLADKICQISSLVKKDTQAHKKEHALETQLPFLQFYSNTFKIIPICMMRLKLEECEEISIAIVKALKQTGRNALIVASSDMTHYETHKSASTKDQSVINQILKLDAKNLYNTVHKRNISMCGTDPTTIMLMCAKDMGAKEAFLAKYMTSGEVNGDKSRVVGYAGLIVR